MATTTKETGGGTAVTKNQKKRAARRKAKKEKDRANGEEERKETGKVRVSEREVIKKTPEVVIDPVAELKRKIEEAKANEVKGKANGT